MILAYPPLCGPNCARTQMTEHTTSGRGVARLLHDIEEARQLLGGIGRSTIYKAIQDGRLTPVKIGTRTLLRRAELERFAGVAPKEAAVTHAA